ncbi:MAG: bile acid:sodium symporter family protein [Bacteroidetes bacterium]|nr:bile acid:sodium symporter family protein [Bacteroidota bacterium]
MESNILLTVFLPVALGVIMLGMGLTLRLEDFKRILVYPKAIALGLVCQLALLPLVCFALVKLFGLQTEMAVGIMILAACPGGPTSNLISHLAKGDTALSISLTAFSSLITVVSIPFIVNFAIVEFMPDGEEQQLNVLKTVISVLVITIIPVAIGMFILSKASGFAQKMGKPVKILSGVFLVAIILAAVLKEKEILVESFKQAGPVALALNVVMMSIGYYLARILKLNIRQSLTISIETGIQNGTLGILIAVTLIGNSQMSIPVAIYSLIMFFTAGLIIYVGNKIIKD